MTRANAPEERYRKAFILLLVIGITATFFSMVANFILTVVMAFIFSMLLRPVYMKVLSRLAGREALSSSIVLLVALIAIGLPLLGVLGMIAAEGVKVGKSVLPWIEEQMQDPADLSARLPRWVPFVEELEPYKSRIMSKVAEWAGSAGSYLVRSISHATKGTAEFVVNFLIMLYAMFFFMMWGPKLTEVTLRYFPLSRDDRKYILEKGLSVTKATLKGVLVIGILQGFLVGVGFWAAGIEGAAFWGSLVVPLSAIPGLGAPIIWGPGAVYLLIQDQIYWSIALIAWGAGVVGTVDNILRPRIVGEATKIPDLLVLLSTLGGITAFGAVGIILGPVLAAILITVLEIYRSAFRTELSASSDSDTDSVT